MVGDGARLTAAGARHVPPRESADLTNLSRDPEVAKAYVADKYTFNKISLRSGTAPKYSPACSLPCCGPLTLGWAASHGVAAPGAGCINQGNVMMRDGHVNFRHPVFIAFGDQDRLTRCASSRQSRCVRSSLSRG